MVTPLELHAPAIRRSSEGYEITVLDGFVRVHGATKITPGILIVKPQTGPVETNAHIDAEELTDATIEVCADAELAVALEDDDEKFSISVTAAEGAEEHWREAVRDGTVRAKVSFRFKDRTLDVDMFFHEDPRLPLKEDPLLSIVCSSGMDVVNQIREHRHYVPPVRYWQNGDSLLLTQTPADDSFVILTWNILAQGLSSGPCGESEVKYASSERCEHTGEVRTAFPHSNLVKSQSNDYGSFIVADTNFLNWDVRKVAIAAEIANINPSIFCLQETDRYGDWLQPVFSALGYDSLFCPKKQSPALSKGWYSDGVCVFWKKDEFTLVKSFLNVQVFNNPVVMIGLKDARGRLMACVTTHLKASECQEAENERLKQVQDSVAKIEEFRQEVLSAENASECAVVFCGDFNTEPFTNDKQEALAVDYITKNTKFESAYFLPRCKDDVSSHGGHHERPSKYAATTVKSRYGGFKDGFACRVIDYIWVEELEVVERLWFPFEKDIETIMLPNKYPSDHYAIAARLKWK